MDQADWNLEREAICEGLDHPEAADCDVVEAGRQLHLSTAHFAARDAAPLVTQKRNTRGK